MGRGGGGRARDLYKENGRQGLLKLGVVGWPPGPDAQRKPPVSGWFQERAGPPTVAEIQKASKYTHGRWPADLILLWLDEGNMGCKLSRSWAGGEIVPRHGPVACSDGRKFNNPVVSDRGPRVP